MTNTKLDVSYQYDIHGQLLEERRNGVSICYAYDKAGNRIRKTDAQGEIHYLYNEKNQLIRGCGAEGERQFTYDCQGGIMEEKNPSGIRQFSYNGRHQQTKVKTENGDVQENRYDVENLRFELLENGNRTAFVYHNGELLHEEGGKGEQTGYHLGVGTSAFQRGQEIYYYHRDEQLNTAFITGADGQVYNSYQYDAFGAEAEVEEQLPNRIRYTGQQYDELTGQYYLRARYYNPVLGRFMQEDTYQGDGLNLYAYCKNNPVTYWDPSGYAGKVTQPSDECPPKGQFGKDEENESKSYKELYRAVSPEEYDDVFKTGGFRAMPDGRTLEAKEFGNSLEDTLNFANHPINVDKAAILEVTIPKSMYDQLNHMNLDTPYFKSGATIVEPDLLDAFNKSIYSIKHVY